MSAAPEKKKKKIPSLIAYILFGIFSTLIISESAVPSDASGVQSFGLSKILAEIINVISPPKKTITASPSSISVASSVGSAKDEDGNVHYLHDNSQAVIGTTRLFNYTLSYSEEKPDIYLSSVSLESLKNPGQGSYSVTLSPSTKGGTVRIIPLLEGDYSFALTDASGHTAEFSFEAVQRLEPADILARESFSLKKGESTVFPFALTFYDLKRTDTSTDHYLARFYDPDLTEFSSSDESIFEVSKGGKLVGKSLGEANLLYKGEAISRISVEGEIAPNDIASITLESEKPCVSPLDYDYVGYGSKLTARYFDALGNELDLADEPTLLYSSSDPLVAMVRDNHLEIVEDALTDCEGGFVSGYRNLGKATIKASLASDPSIYAEIEIESKPVAPSSVVITPSSSGKALADGASLQTGSTISFASSFEPKNCGNKNIHIEVNDASLATINNNDSTSPTLSLIKDGDLVISYYSVALGEASKGTTKVTVTPRPAISGGDMTEFASFMRKAIGHFSLFLVTGVFQAIAFFLTLAKRKRELLLYGGVSVFTGFALAGISEAIQAIPSLHRGSTWADVGIDTFGYFVGVLLVYFIFVIVFLLKEKMGSKDKENE